MSLDKQALIQSFKEELEQRNDANETALVDVVLSRVSPVRKSEEGDREFRIITIEGKPKSISEKVIDTEFMNKLSRTLWEPKTVAIELSEYNGENAIVGLYFKE